MLNEDYRKKVKKLLAEGKITRDEADKLEKSIEISTDLELLNERDATTGWLEYLFGDVQETSLAAMINLTCFILLLLTIILVTLGFTYLTYNIVLIKTVVFHVFIPIIFFLTLLKGCRKGGNLIWDNSFYIMKLFIIISFIPLLFTPFKYAVLSCTADYICYFLLLFVVINIIKNSFTYGTTIFVISVIAIPASILGILQKLDIQLFPWGQKVFVSTFGNTDFFAGYILLILPVIINLLIFLAGRIYRSKTESKILYIISAAVSLIIIILLIINIHFVGWFKMAAPLITLILISIITYILVNIDGLFSSTSAMKESAGTAQNKDIPAKKRTGRILTVSMIVTIIFAIVSILIFKSFTGIKPDFSKEKSLLFYGDGTIMKRYVMSKGAYKIFADNPVLGSGSGTFHVEFPKYREPYYNRVGVSHNTLHAHNEFLQILAENGITGYLVLIFFFVFTYLKTCFVLKNVKDKLVRTVTPGCFAGIAAFLCFNLYTPNARWIGQTFYMWLLLGIILAASNFSAVKISRINKKFIWPGIFLAIILISLSVYYNYKRFRSNCLFKKAVNRLNKKKYIDSAELFRKSIKCNKYMLAAYYKLGYAQLLLKDYNSALKTYEYLQELAPDYAQIHLNKEYIYARFNKTEEAEKEIEAGLTLNNDFNTLRFAAGFYMDSNLKDKAAAALKRTVNILNEDKLILKLKKRWADMKDSEYDKQLKAIKSNIKYAETLIQKLKWPLSYSKIDRITDDSPESLYQKGAGYLKKGSYLNAFECYAGLISDFPMSNRAGCALVYMGSLMQNLQNNNEAETYLRQAIKNNFEAKYGDGARVGTLALLHLGVMYVDQDSASEAVKPFKKILQDYPDDTDHRKRKLSEGIYYYLMKKGKTGIFNKLKNYFPEKIQEVYNESQFNFFSDYNNIKENLEQGDFRSVLNMYDNLTSDEPVTDELRFYQACALYGLKQDEKCFDILDTLKSKYIPQPAKLVYYNEVSFKLLYADGLLKENKFSEALKIYKEIKAEMPIDIGASYWIENNVVFGQQSLKKYLEKMIEYSSLKGKSREDIFRVVGRTAERIELSLQTHSSSAHTLFSDILRKSGDADIGFTNRLGVRGSFNKENIRIIDLLLAYPWSEQNSMTTMKLTGRQIKEIMFRGYNSVHFIFPSSNVKMNFIPDKYDISRFDKMTIDDKLVEDDKLYKIATTSYLGHGGDMFTIFLQGKDSTDRGKKNIKYITEYISENLPLK